MEYIYIRDNALSGDFCKHLINKFEQDKRSEPGMIATSNLEGVVDKSVKDSQDLQISQLSDWRDEDKGICEGLKPHLYHYQNKMEFSPFMVQSRMDSGYQIQRTPPGGGYDWHHDFISLPNSMGARTLTFIFYLNDIERDGYTEFLNGPKVQPKEGRILIFPATWTFIHRGYPPQDETKYICTGWFWDGTPQ